MFYAKHKIIHGTQLMSHLITAIIKERVPFFLMFLLAYMMAIVACQLDGIWNEIQSRNGGHTC